MRPGWQCTSARPAAALLVLLDDRLYVRSCVGAGPGCVTRLHSPENDADYSSFGSPERRQGLALPGNAYDASEFEIPGREAAGQNARRVGCRAGENC